MKLNYCEKTKATERPSCEPVGAEPEKEVKRWKGNHSRKGKVARLPSEVRISICQMMHEGLSSRAILEKLGGDRHGLNQNNLSTWKRGGFLDWQRENKWEAELKAQQQFALHLLLTNDETKLPQVVLQIAATQVFQALREVMPTNLKGKFDAGASEYTRLLNSIARISRSSLVFSKYSHLCEKEKTAELKRLDPTRKLNENECGVLAKAWQDFFLGPDYDPMAHPLHEGQSVTPSPGNDAWLSKQGVRNDEIGRAVPPHPGPLPRGEGESSASHGADERAGVQSAEASLSENSLRPHEPQKETRTPHPGPLPLGRGEGEASAGRGAGDDAHELGSETQTPHPGPPAIELKGSERSDLLSPALSSKGGEGEAAAENPKLEIRNPKS